MEHVIKVSFLALRWTVFSMFLALVGSMPSACSAQIGIQGQFRLPVSMSESSDLADPLIRSGWQVGAIYSIRQSGIRIEILPGVHYLQTSAESLSGHSFSGSGAQASLDIRLYPMDLYGDCKCPTFSRKGQVIKKGFFLEAGFGGFYLNQETSVDSESSTNFFGRIGAGLDIGLSRRWTMTPGVRLQYEHHLHAWGISPSQKQSLPLWVYPYVQLMTYFED